MSQVKAEITHVCTRQIFELDSQEGLNDSYTIEIVTLNTDTLEDLSSCLHEEEIETINRLWRGNTSLAEKQRETNVLNQSVVLARNKKNEIVGVVHVAQRTNVKGISEPVFEISEMVTNLPHNLDGFSVIEALYTNATLNAPEILTKDQNDALGNGYTIIAKTTLDSSQEQAHKYAGNLRRILRIAGIEWNARENKGYFPLSDLHHTSEQLPNQPKRNRLYMEEPIKHFRIVIIDEKATSSTHKYQIELVGHMPSLEITRILNSLPNL